MNQFNKHNYRELKPIQALDELVHSFYTAKNISEESDQLTIVPDSYAKLIIVVQNQKVVQYYMTGFYLREKIVVMPPNSIHYGCRLKILAPEFLLGQELASIMQSQKQLNLSFLNLAHFDFSSFEKIVAQWQFEMMKMKSSSEISGKKLRLAQLVEATKGDITVKELSKQIFWSTSQINRYMNKYVGLSLKRYLNLKKVYNAYLQIREGNFFPKSAYFDQAHFIREVKKHTGETPSKLHEEINARFIQLKHIKEK